MSLYELQVKIEHARPTIALEPQLDKEHEATVDGTQNSIIYHYLTFETTLPLAS